METKRKWTASAGEAEREQFNAVIKFLIAPWEMCFGVAPGQLSITPRPFKSQSTYTHTHTHNTQHAIWTNRNLIPSRLSALSSQFQIPEYVSASPNDASTRRDTKEAQTGRRDGCEKPSLAVTLTLLSLTHCSAHTTVALTSAHKSYLWEHERKPVSENILFFPFMFTVHRHASSIQTCLLLLPLFYWLIYLYFLGAAWQNISEANVIPSADLQSSKFDKMANVLPSCTGVQLVSVQPCHVKGAHQGEERERCGTLEWKGWQEERTQRDIREERERERRNRQLHPASLPHSYPSPPSGHAEQQHEQ